jgi:catechol 2,3-dioxygenase-like lactoylglutathione lyase family enzyme
MAETKANQKDAYGWKYTRPVLFVADVQRAIRFYVDVLGFETKWHEADGKGTVCQVNRGDTEVILCQDATRHDKSRLFVELNPAELAQLRREIEEKSIPWEKSWWGYDVIKIVDPDGNEWLCAHD